MTERLHFHFSLSCIGEGNGNPLQYSCLENPRDEGAWLAAVSGVAQSWTRLKQLSSSSSSSQHLKTRRFQPEVWSLFSGKMSMSAQQWSAKQSGVPLCLGCGTLVLRSLACPLHLFKNHLPALVAISVCNPRNRAIAFYDPLSSVCPNNCS